MNSVSTNSNAQLDHFKSILNARRDETLNNLHRAEVEQRGLDTERPAELGDSCIASSVREDPFDRINHHRELLNKIERHRSGSNTERLASVAPAAMTSSSSAGKFSPGTKLCLRCQENFEQSTAPRSLWPAIRSTRNAAAGE